MTAVAVLRARRLAVPPEVAWLAVVLAGALAIRIAAVDRSLWLDETISLLQVDRSLAGVVQTQVNGVHPPLYHILLHGWLNLLGATPGVLRAYSVGWSLVGVVAVWGWSRQAFPHASPVPAAALAAFAPFSVWYGTEIRMYAQLFALVALGGWLAWSVLDRGVSGRRLVGLAACLVAAMYTHYFASLAIAALGTVALVLLAGGRPARTRSLAVLGACVTAAGSAMPWITYVVLNREAQPLTTVFEDPDVFTALIAGLEMLTGFRSFAVLGLLAAGWPALCLLAMLLLPQLGGVRWRAGGVVALLLLPPFMLVSLSLLAPRSAFDSRYLTVCAAPLYVVSGWAWTWLRNRRLRVVIGLALVAAAMAGAVWQNHDPSNPKLYQLREALTAINALARPGDAVMLVPQVNELGGRDPVLSFYRPAPGVRSVDTSPDGEPGTVAPEETWRRARRTRPERLFVVYGFNALVYSLGDARVLTGSGLSVRYDRFLAARGRRVGTLRYANVTVGVYAPDWGRRR
jgi:4-amino-4-deoxy-L-arabinose transferase-like glycosyltransferase